MIKEIKLSADTDLPPVALLKAGTLTCLYELGKLRYIKCGDEEIIRMLYGAVRDEHWGTLPCTITGEEVMAQDDHFSVQYTAVYGRDTPVYKAIYNIEGKPDNTIVFSMKGEALTAFKKNRIGLCAHHPVKECRGQMVAITRPGNASYESVFPEGISPWQPFHEVSQMRWRVNGRTGAELFFTGDVFETEDQRNWSDSSYKTYSTPLAIPFPVEVAAGDRLEQAIRLAVDKDDKERAAGSAEPIYHEEKIPFPAIGYSRAINQPVLNNDLVQHLQKIPFRHYRVMLAMDKPEWQKELLTVMAEAAQLNTRLELVLFFSADFCKELEALLPLLEQNPALLFSLLPLQKDNAVTPAALQQYVYPRIKNVLPAVHTGWGTDQFFTEVNRQRPANLPFDFMSFSMHPQVHAADSRSLLENLESQPDIIGTAGSFAAGKPVFVSPLTLKDRYYLPAPDQRQYSQLTAWWMLMSIQQLSMAGSVTCFELMGDAGLLRPAPAQESGTGYLKLSPAYEVLAAVHAFQPAWVIKRYSGSEIVMDSVLLENANGDRLLFRAPHAYSSFKSR